MDEENKETIVINELLCYVACKHSIMNCDKLAKVIEKHFTKESVIDACETLQNCSSGPLPLAIRKRKSNQNAIETIIKYMQETPENELPVFVCQNLNNLPKIKKSNEEIELLKEEYRILTMKIIDITKLILQLNNQLKVLGGKSLNEKLKEGNRPPKNGLAYLQKLIDEDEKKNTSKMISEEYSGDESIIGEIDILQKENSFEKKISEKLVIDSEGMDTTDSFKLIATREKSSTSLQKNLDSPSAKEAIEVCPETGLVKITVDDFFPDCVKPNEINNGLVEDCAFTLKNKLNNEEDAYECSLCKYKTICEKSFQQHMDSHLNTTQINTVNNKENGRHQCLLCLQEFNNKKLLKEHNKKCPTMSFESGTAGAFPDSSDLLEMEERHVCPVCNSFFASKFSLTNHKAFHDKVRTFVCSVCEYRFYTQESLDTHYKVHTDGIYKCPYCEYGNAIRRRVINHIQCHIGYKPFKCKLCNYKASSNSVLERHILTHSDLKKFRCPECDASFKTKDKLSAHKRLHIKGKPYKCPECGKGFKIPSAMRIHHRTHTDYKPHSCPLCPYKARTAAILRIHSNIHSAEKPFKCTICDFKANQKSYLSWHMKAYHPES